MKKKSKKRASAVILQCIGLLLLVAAVGLTGYNLWDESRAGRESNSLLNVLTAELQGKAGEEQEEIEGTRPAEIRYKDYQLNPEMPMPEKDVDGIQCIAILEIPSLSLKLPVSSTWDYVLLKKCPCRYYGSAYTKDLVIAAHNYNPHFGYIKNLNQGEEVILTDMDGDVFRYKVVAVEILGPYEHVDMVDSGWDLTLFTCTLGGASRVTVRCEQIDDAIGVSFR